MFYANVKDMYIDIKSLNNINQTLYQFNVGEPIVC